MARRRHIGRTARRPRTAHGLIVLRVYLVHLFRAAKRLRPRVAAAIALFLGSALTVAGASRLAANNDSEATRRFDVLAERTANSVTTRMAIYEYGLRGTRGAVIASGAEHFDRRRLEEYNATRDFAREVPGRAWLRRRSARRGA